MMGRGGVGGWAVGGGVGGGVDKSRGLVDGQSAGLVGKAGEWWVGKARGGRTKGAGWRGHMGRWTRVLRIGMRRSWRMGILTRGEKQTL